MAGEDNYAQPHLLADTAWLEESLDDPNLCIIDTDVPEEYRRAHIPGSKVINDHYQKSPDQGRVHILGAQEFADLAESLGIGDDTTVVAYDNSRGLYAARLWWALTYYGHTNVKVLNGGWRKWLSEDRPVTTKSNKMRPASKFTSNVNKSLMVTAEQLMEDYLKDEVLVWDVRSRAEYTGEVTRGNKRPGHIPGATHLEWLDLVNERTHLLKPATEIRAILESHGITPDKRIEAH